MVEATPTDASDCSRVIGRSRSAWSIPLRGDPGYVEVEGRGSESDDPKPRRWVLLELDYVM